MDRIYMNRIDGQRRVHIEITSSEVSDLLDDLQADPEHFASTRLFLGILRAAEETFAPTVAEGRRNRDAARQAAGQTPTTEPLRPRAERCPELECTDEQQCWRCDYEESQHAARSAAPAVEQPAEAQPAEVLRVRDRWYVEYLFGRGSDAWWGVAQGPHISREQALAEKESRRDEPVERRLVRETTTWTVEETR